MSIEQDIAQIRGAIYGREVRESIAHGLEQCYEDSTANAQIALIEAKGAETIASIPSDYSTLSAGVVRHDISQSLTDAQKLQARANVGAAPLGLMPETYGAVGDGTTDDTNAMLECLAAAYQQKRPVYFREGRTYTTSRELQIYNRIALYGNGATIKFTGSSGNMLFYSDADVDQFPDAAGRAVIRDLTFNGGGTAACCIAIGTAKGLVVENLDIYGFTGVGIASSAGFENFFRDIRIAGDGSVGQRGMICGASDSRYTEIVTKNCETGIRNEGNANSFEHVHSWNTVPAIIPTSVMIETISALRAYNLYADTCAIGVKVLNDVSVLVDGFMVVHGESLVSGHTPCVFQPVSAAAIDRIKCSGAEWINSTASGVSYNLFSMAPGAYGRDFDWRQANAASLQAMGNLPGPVVLSGTHDDLTAGSASQLLSTTGVTDQTPYVLRQSGGGVSIGDRAVEKIVGGTVCWNQLNNNERDTRTASGVTATNNGDGTWTISGTATDTTRINFKTDLTTIAGHVYYLTGAPVNTAQYGPGILRVLLIQGSTTGSRVWADSAAGTIVKSTNYQWTAISFYTLNGVTYDNLILRPQLFDLTAMFGSTVADAVYAMEQASAGAGVSWFRALFPNDYYAYNAGELMSVQTSGKQVVSADSTVTKLYHLDSSLTLRGIPKWDSTAGAMYYDGDEYASDGTVTRRYGIVDLGTLTWGQASGVSMFYTASGPAFGGNGVAKYRGGGVLPGYENAAVDTQNPVDLRWFIANNDVTPILRVSDSRFADAADFKAAMSGVYLVYELATPTTESADPYTGTQWVDEYGTEEFIDSRDVAIPVGHTTFYPENLRTKLEETPDSPATDGDYIMRRSGGQNAYALLQQDVSLGITGASAGQMAKIATVDNNGIPTAWAATDEVSELKSALTGYVSIDGTDEVTPKNLQILDKVISPNLIDTSKITDGKYISADGVEHNGNYFVTDYIPVEAGSQYCGKWLFTNATTGNTILYDLNIRWLACYDSTRTIMPSAGSDTAITTYPYTIPNGVSYVRLSCNNNASYSQYQFEKGTVSTAYHPYGEVLSAVIKASYIPDEDVDMADIPAFHLVEGQNLINKNDADYVTGKYIARDGNLRDNTAFATTGFISVTPGDTLLGSYLTGDGVTASATLAYIAAYDSNKTAVVNSGVSAGSSVSYIVPEGIYYVRCSIRVGSYTTEIQITKTDSGLPKPYKSYEAPHYEILESYTPQGEPPLHVYLPSDIYVAVGRTIELYNEQVCIDHEKYHFRWVCAEGSAYSRKFSITGTTAKNLNLDLYLYDDKKKICWCGRCVIHVVAASNPTKKILPIGDSLTNWKAWLQETMLLSENHISWLGTRYSGLSVDSAGNTYASGTIHHEGRSGWSASDYLTDSTYTFDDRYDGALSVSGSANPFWSGSAFSLTHYLTTQTGVSTPDAVQIFLGTNDIRNGIESATANIVSMVQTIRTEYPDMPIFICNTIYNANQNGYGSVGSDAYAASAGASAWQYEQDCLVMDLMKSLKAALSAITGVYIIPLASCMDREYDFGQVMTKVNPRSDVEVAMPVERIHPQAVGYYQMADLMYSFYCGVLN